MTRKPQPIYTKMFLTQEALKKKAALIREYQRIMKSKDMIEAAKKLKIKQNIEYQNKRAKLRKKTNECIKEMGGYMPKEEICPLICLDEDWVLKNKMKDKFLPLDLRKDWV